jgi:hypothetical protein
MLSLSCYPAKAESDIDVDMAAIGAVIATPWSAN